MSEPYDSQNRRSNAVLAASNVVAAIIQSTNFKLNPMGFDAYTETVKMSQALERYIETGQLEKR